MTRHDTPENVASVLAGWAPDRVRTVLEPAVGTGALLAPLLRRFGKRLDRVVAIDTDPEALAHVKERFGSTLNSSLSIHCGDFLEWQASDQAEAHKHGFDCVIMNPPFAGKKNALVPVEMLIGANGRGEGRHAPLEGAFLLKAVRMLNAGGRILAIVPGSIIAGDSGHWIRKHLLEAGRIICVHELPRFTFPNVERVYLFIFERSTRVKPIKLSNHSLVKPDSLVLSHGELGNDLRLDYEFQAAVRWYGLLRLATPEVGWSELKNLASVQRGKAESPGGMKSAVHTVDFRDGFWSIERLHKRRVSGKDKSAGLKSSDLLVTRVGRQCVKSLGPAVGAGGLDWTDCLFCIRPNGSLDRNRLMFSLRLLFAFDEGRKLVQRGSGATYITEKGLSKLLVPVHLSEMFPKHFGAYEEAIRLRSGERIVGIEEELKAKVTKIIDRHK